VILPIGYGDGYPRNLSNQGPVLIKGRIFRISGRVCMDQMMCDVHDADIKVGDEAVLVGAQGRQRITTEELAVLCGTIPYEIVCGLGSRIPRVYTK
jgi:alanine racemase